MGDRALDILEREFPVDIDRGIKGLDPFVRRSLEAAAPHPQVVLAHDVDSDWYCHVPPTRFFKVLRSSLRSASLYPSR